MYFGEGRFIDLLGGHHCVRQYGRFNCPDPVCFETVGVSPRTLLVHVRGRYTLCQTDHWRLRYMFVVALESSHFKKGVLP